MSSEEEKKIEKEYKYLFIRQERIKFRNLWRFLKKGEILGSNETHFIESSSFDVEEEEEEEDASMGNRSVVYKGEAKERWVIMVSVIMKKLLVLVSKPMEWVGFFWEFLLNLLSLNSSLFGFICNFLRGKLVIPQRGSASFISTTGHLDERMNLCETDKFGDKSSNEKDMGNRSLMDLCIMASKLSYENENVIKEIVVNHWKMHFVGFYNCWNDYQKLMSTQVFILCDKPVDANLILISFRGTEPFQANDWSTDVDCSWYEIPDKGRVHVGFLEALGLGNRTNPTSFQNHLQMKDIEVPSFDSPTVGTNPSPDMAKLTAYDIVKTKVKELLMEHKNAKFVVTGHSLGGALAVLFPTVLVLHEEKEMMEKLLAVYTFGQPRVTDRNLGNFMESQLNKLEPRYFRVVYCNDVVPRLPYDNSTFLFKHFGVCLYYDRFYVEQKVDEEPNRNYFGMRYFIPEHANAMWELIRAFMMGHMYGLEYKETWYSIMLRVVGLAFPGCSAHSPRDYINSVRLGRELMV